ncbi:transcriptional regulator [Staphylococcus shinii]|uniref:helix-turn-helix transcriptional regulator n=1 Tax=Staphylococcus TaxID=1279 RepID=UPI0003F4EA79|nr:MULTISPECIES: helix-turn-helix domain-containing protein [Staphylococcus]PKI09092.1 transcriptional regulator [Staphylococcus shinii]
MINKIAGYRKMLGLSQSELATKMRVSAQAYSQKENGKVPFKDTEKTLFKKMLLPYFPDITIDEIFFDNVLSEVEFYEE